MGTEISFSTNLELLNLFCYVFYNWFLILSVVNLITEKIYIIENKKTDISQIFGTALLF